MDVLTKLRNVLMNLYPSSEDAIRIVQQAGLSSAYIDFTGAAINIWHKVLEQAKREKFVGRILKEAQEEYPKNQALKRAAESWQAVQDLPDDRPEPPPDRRPKLQHKLAGNPNSMKDASSPFYIERDSDQIMLEAFQNQGVTITIMGPSGLGSRLLLSRLKPEAKKLRKRVAYVNFYEFGTNDFVDAQRFFKLFCRTVTRKLSLQDNTDKFWDDHYADLQNCKFYFNDYLIKASPEPLVLVIENVERVFKATGFREDFFGMLRSWHEARVMEDWKHFDMILATSTEPNLFIDNENQSPFNVGLKLELQDFNVYQVAELNQRYKSILSEAQCTQLMSLVGGHPYLVAQALYVTASGQKTIQELFDQCAEDQGPFRDFLRSQLKKLRNSEKLKNGMSQVIKHQRCDDETTCSWLEGAGLVIRDRWSRVIPRYALYQSYFESHLT